MGAVERAGDDVEASGAGDSAVGVPAMVFDEAVEEKRLESGAGCCKGAGRFGEVGRGEKTTGGDLHDKDAGIGVEAGGVGDCGGPGGGRGSVNLGMNRGVRSDERAAEREL
jgi:hypothetical protein